MLAYGVDKQTFGSVERFHLYDRRYAPFFMDTAGSSRIVGLIRQTLLFEEGRVIYLLVGVPRRWLEAGKEIQVKNGVTAFSRLNLRVRSEADQGRIECDLNISELQPGGAESVFLRLPHPERRAMQGVTWNGKSWPQFDVQNEIIQLKAVPGRHELVVTYS
jgi:hypothetical protein